MSLAVGLLLRSLPAVAALPVKEWSAKYRNWHYYADFAVPPGPLGWADTSVIYQLAEAPGIYYMTYTVFDGVGYQVTRAESSDLLYWKTSANFIYSPRNGVPPLDWNATEGEFDYGGASFIGPLLNNYSMEAPRVLKRSGGSYWYAYYGQPRRGGLELDPGGSGFARSADGLDWERAEATPCLATSDPDVRPWEQACEYAPYLLESDGQFVVFWNAKGPNAQGQLSEESGIATLPLSAALPGTQSNRTLWRREPSNPVLKTGLSSEGQYDTYQAADPKVWWDGDHWTMFYFGCCSSHTGGAAIMVAFSTDLTHWEKDDTPLYEPGGHPAGLDAKHAHKVWLVYRGGVGYMFYTAVGTHGRGIALLTSQPVPAP